MNGPGRPHRDVLEDEDHAQLVVARIRARRRPGTGSARRWPGRGPRSTPIRGSWSPGTRSRRGRCSRRQRTRRSPIQISATASIGTSTAWSRLSWPMTGGMPSNVVPRSKSSSSTWPKYGRPSISRTGSGGSSAGPLQADQGVTRGMGGRSVGLGAVVGPSARELGDAAGMPASGPDGPRAGRIRRPAGRPAPSCAIAPVSGTRGRGRAARTCGRELLDLHPGADGFDRPGSGRLVPSAAPRVAPGRPALRPPSCHDVPRCGIRQFSRSSRRRTASASASALSSITYGAPRARAACASPSTRGTGSWFRSRSRRAAAGRARRRESRRSCESARPGWSRHLDRQARERDEARARGGARDGGLVPYRGELHRVRVLAEPRGTTGRARPSSARARTRAMSWWSASRLASAARWSASWRPGCASGRPKPSSGAIADARAGARRGADPRRHPRSQEPVGERLAEGPADVLVAARAGARRTRSRPSSSTSSRTCACSDTARAFWALVAARRPTHLADRAWLRRNSHALHAALDVAPELAPAVARGSADEPVRPRPGVRDRRDRAHRRPPWVSNRWLAEHHRRYRRLPGTDWWREQDRDPTVERWRRLRLLVLVPTVAAFATAVTLLITAR